jgi:hypothetical protein
MALCDYYLEIISGKEKPPMKVLARNALTLIAVMFTGEKRISSLVGKVRQNPQFDPNGIHIGRCEMILGLLYKAKKKRSLAVQHLTEAKRIVSQFGADADAGENRSGFDGACVNMRMQKRRSTATRAFAAA